MCIRDRPRLASRSSESTLEETASSDEAPASEEGEMDPELAALLKSLE